MLRDSLQPFIDEAKSPSEAYFWSLCHKRNKERGSYLKERICLRCRCKIKTETARLCSTCQRHNERLGKLYAGMDKDAV